MRVALISNHSLGWRKLGKNPGSKALTAVNSRSYPMPVTPKLPEAMPNGALIHSMVGFQGKKSYKTVIYQKFIFLRAKDQNI